MGRDMLIRENAAYGALHPVGKMAHLEALGEQGHHNARAHEQYQHGQPPDEAVHRTVDLFDDFQESLHNISPLPEKIWIHYTTALSFLQVCKTNLA